jgi:PadR family transcriptional regulator, regulatory protein PadR
MKASKRSSPLLHGTLEALIMKSLANGPRHGYAVGRWIEDGTADVIQVEEGSLYPALYRMESRGWIEAEWGQTETNRKAKFYRLTKEGRRRLAIETERWAAFSAAISRVLLPA